MKPVSLLSIFLSCFIFHKEVKAHTALGEEQLANFNSWTRCLKRPSEDSKKLLTCTFPMQGSEHTDAMTVYCEENRIVPFWEDQWMQKWGKTEFIDLPTEAWIVLPANTVQMFTFHCNFTHQNY